MASSTTPTPPMRAGWTASGACTSGSIARPRDATRRASGGCATTSTESGESGVANRRAGDLRTHGFRASFEADLLRGLGAALRRQRYDDRPLRAHVGDGRDADAGNDNAGGLGDVGGVDADARTDVARCRGLVPWHVDRDDDGDDAAIPGADAVALSPDRRPGRRGAARPADRAGGPGVL